MFIKDIIDNAVNAGFAFGQDNEYSAAQINALYENDSQFEFNINGNTITVTNQYNTYVQLGNYKVDVDDGVNDLSLAQKNILTESGQTWADINNHVSDVYRGTVQIQGYQPDNNNEPRKVSELLSGLINESDSLDVTGGTPEGTFNAQIEYKLIENTLQKITSIAQQGKDSNAYLDTGSTIFIAGNPPQTISQITNARNYGLNTMQTNGTVNISARDLLLTNQFELDDKNNISIYFKTGKYKYIHFYDVFNNEILTNNNLVTASIVAIRFKLIDDLPFQSGNGPTHFNDDVNIYTDIQLTDAYVNNRTVDDSKNFFNENKVINTDVNGNKSIRGVRRIYPRDTYETTDDVTVGFIYLYTLGGNQFLNKPNTLLTNHVEKITLLDRIDITIPRAQEQTVTGFSPEYGEHTNIDMRGLYNVLQKINNFHGTTTSSLALSRLTWNLKSLGNVVDRFDNNTPIYELEVNFEYGNNKNTYLTHGLRAFVKRVANADENLIDESGEYGDINTFGRFVQVLPKNPQDYDPTNYLPKNSIPEVRGNSALQQWETEYDNVALNLFEWELHPEGTLKLRNFYVYDPNVMGYRNRRWSKIKKEVANINGTYEAAEHHPHSWEEIGLTVADVMGENNDFNGIISSEIIIIMQSPCYQAVQGHDSDTTVISGNMDFGFGCDWDNPAPGEKMTSNGTIILNADNDNINTTSQLEVTIFETRNTAQGVERTGVQWNRVLNSLDQQCSANYVNGNSTSTLTSKFKINNIARVIPGQTSGCNPEVSDANTVLEITTTSMRPMLSTVMYSTSTSEATHNNYNWQIATTTVASSNISIKTNYNPTTYSTDSLITGSSDTKTYNRSIVSVMNGNIGFALRSSSRDLVTDIITSTDYIGVRTTQGRCEAIGTDDMPYTINVVRSNAYARVNISQPLLDETSQTFQSRKYLLTSQLVNNRPIYELESNNTDAAGEFTDMLLSQLADNTIINNGTGKSSNLYEHDNMYYYMTPDEADYGDYSATDVTNVPNVLHAELKLSLPNANPTVKLSSRNNYPKYTIVGKKSEWVDKANPNITIDKVPTKSEEDGKYYVTSDNEKSNKIEVEKVSCLARYVRITAQSRVVDNQGNETWVATTEKIVPRRIFPALVIPENAGDNAGGNAADDTNDNGNLNFVVDASGILIQLNDLDQDTEVNRTQTIEFDYVSTSSSEKEVRFLAQHYAATFNNGVVTGKGAMLGTEIVLTGEDKNVGDPDGIVTFNGVTLYQNPTALGNTTVSIPKETINTVTTELSTLRPVVHVYRETLRNDSEFKKNQTRFALIKTPTTTKNEVNGESSNDPITLITNLSPIVLPVVPGVQNNPLDIDSNIVDYQNNAQEIKASLMEAGKTFDQHQTILNLSGIKYGPNKLSYTTAKLTRLLTDNKKSNHIVGQGQSMVVYYQKTSGAQTFVETTSNTLQEQDERIRSYYNTERVSYSGSEHQRLSIPGRSALNVTLVKTFNTNPTEIRRQVADALQEDVASLKFVLKEKPLTFVVDVQEYNNGLNLLAVDNVGAAFNSLESIKGVQIPAEDVTDEDGNVTTNDAYYPGKPVVYTKGNSSIQVNYQTMEVVDDNTTNIQVGFDNTNTANYKIDVGSWNGTTFTPAQNNGNDVVTGWLDTQYVRLHVPINIDNSNGNKTQEGIQHIIFRNKTTSSTSLHKTNSTPDKTLSARLQVELYKGRSTDLVPIPVDSNIGRTTDGPEIINTLRRAGVGYCIDNVRNFVLNTKPQISILASSVAITQQTGVQANRQRRIMQFGNFSKENGYYAGPKQKNVRMTPLYWEVDVITPPNVGTMNAETTPTIIFGGFSSYYDGGSRQSTVVLGNKDLYGNELDKDKININDIYSLWNIGRLDDDGITRLDIGNQNMSATYRFTSNVNAIAQSTFPLSIELNDGTIAFPEDPVVGAMVQFGDKSYPATHKLTLNTGAGNENVNLHLTQSVISQSILTASQIKTKVNTTRNNTNYASNDHDSTSVVNVVGTKSNLVNTYSIITKDLTEGSEDKALWLRSGSAENARAQDQIDMGYGKTTAYLDNN